MITLDEMEVELQEIFGQNFFQFAFYVDNRKQNNIGKYWVKVESDISGHYNAWQVRDAVSLEEAWIEIIKKIKEKIS